MNKNSVELNTILFSPTFFKVVSKTTFFIVLKRLKTLIFRKFAYKKSNYLPFLV